MPADRDPLDILRAAWQEVDAPEVPGGGRLAEEDEVTRATVRWARQAWAATPIPSPAGLPRRRGRILRLTFTQVAAAAALLLVSVGLMAIDRADSGSVSPAAPHDVARAAPPSAALAPEASPTDPLVVLLGSEACVCSPIEAFRAPLPILSVVQRSALLESAMRANRNGSWSDAAEKARLVLDRAGATPEDRLGALCQLALSFQALGQHDESTAYLSRLQEEISDQRAR